MRDRFILTADLDGAEIYPEVWFELLLNLWMNFVSEMGLILQDRGTQIQILKGHKDFFQ